MMSKTFDTQLTVVITGASRRLGLHLTQDFLQGGYHIVAITRESSEALEGLSKSENLFIYLCDYQDEQSITKTAQDIKNKFPKIKAIINNASLFEKDSIELSDWPTQLQELNNIHVVLPTLLTEILKENLSDEGNPGKVINITDIYVKNPIQSHSLYCASKSGLEILTKTMAQRYAPNIHVNSIRPGPIKFLPSHTGKDRDSILLSTLLKREGGFKPISDAVNFLIHTDFVTGTAFQIDGGRSLVNGSIKDY